MISIVMPMRNASPYIRECLDSIRAQTYPHWELHVVDDNSTDDSFDIVSAYSATDPRIKIHRNPGRGILSALRFALSLSNGLFIPALKKRKNKS